MDWYYYLYIGLDLLGVILFFALAQRRSYRDPTAAKTYEAIRNKLTVREEEPEEDDDEEEDVEFEDSGSGFSLMSLVVGIFVIGITVFIGVTIMNTMQDVLVTGTAAANVTGSSAELLSTTTKWFPILFAVMIGGVVLSVLFRMFSSPSY